MLCPMHIHGNGTLPGDGWCAYGKKAFRPDDGLRGNLPDGCTFHADKLCPLPTCLPGMRGNLSGMRPQLRADRWHGRLCQHMLGMCGTMRPDGRIEVRESQSAPTVSFHVSGAPFGGSASRVGCEGGHVDDVGILRIERDDLNRLVKADQHRADQGRAAELLQHLRCDGS